MTLAKNILWSPAEYAAAAVIAREAGEEMLARLELMTLKPNVIVDAGCGTGELSAQLQSRYQDAYILTIDTSETMLRHLQDCLPQCGRGIVCAKAEKMPLRDQSVDLVFANLLLPWCHDITSMLQEWRRILRPDGLLMLSAFGLDTLREWSEIFQDTEIPQLIDMHDIGDLLLQEGFVDPVLDVNHYTTTYREKNQLIHELRASGMWFPQDQHQAEQVTVSDAFPPDDALVVTYEVIQAHAFAPVISEEISASADGVVRVPLAHLRQRLRAKG